MDPALLERFLGRLIDGGNTRIARGRTILAAGSPDGAAELASAFHRLGGEAGILGFTGIAGLAREVEVLAERAAGDPEARRACERAIDQLERALAALAPSD